MTLDTIWLIIGFLGQGIFFMRWVVQWIASERHAESRVPTAFWYMSMIGGLITLADLAQWRPLLLALRHRISGGFMARGLTCGPRRPPAVPWSTG